MNVILGILAAYGLSTGLYLALTEDSPEFGSGILGGTVACIVLAVLYTNGVFS